ncbi:uncharacterized protein DNG_03160 [Cephalotrichum gorgonifer]|uniref:Uncharacterized protein n=1 Tax=Cephalotrichum gorgonifer TaxID=2041049 RepID=A0AAE8MVT3_9PEZI|nr:uncharacterized protein DNG_03160 [Cephalotrichum gorgonifer]
MASLQAERPGTGIEPPTSIPKPPPSTPNSVSTDLVILDDPSSSDDTPRALISCDRFKYPPLAFVPFQTRDIPFVNTWGRATSATTHADSGYEDAQSVISDTRPLLRKQTQGEGEKDDNGATAYHDSAPLQTMITPQKQRVESVDTPSPSSPSGLVSAPLDICSTASEIGASNCSSPNAGREKTLCSEEGEHMAEMNKPESSDSEDDSSDVDSLQRVGLRFDLDEGTESDTPLDLSAASTATGSSGFELVDSPSQPPSPWLEMWYEAASMTLYHSLTVHGAASNDGTQRPPDNGTLNILDSQHSGISTNRVLVGGWNDGGLNRDDNQGDEDPDPKRRRTMDPAEGSVVGLKFACPYQKRHISDGLSCGRPHGVSKTYGNIYFGVMESVTTAQTAGELARANPMRLDATKKTVQCGLRPLSVG